MGFQAENALMTGWVLDQRVDGAGGFITNTSPTSSGFTFLSTGDATQFYVSGRAVKIVQAAGTAEATVGQSSFAAGITTVYLNQFSTQAGLSTVASSGAITNVAASPIFPRTTDNNTFGGWLISATTGLSPTLVAPSTVVIGGSVIASNVSIGSTAITSVATQGMLRGVAGGAVYARSVGDSYNEQLIGQDSTAADIVRMGSPGGNIQPVYLGNGFFIISGASLTVGSTVSAAGSPAGTIRLGTTPASSGYIRLPNSAIAIVGKTSTGGDDVIYPHQQLTTYLSSDIALSQLNTFITVLSLTLPVGTWLLNGAWMANSTASSNPSLGVRIFDGTASKAAGMIAASFAASTANNGISLPISAIVSHTTTLTYSLQVLDSASTQIVAAAQTALAASTNTTYLTAVKIG